MTCTVGYKNSTEIVMGADSCSSDDDGTFMIRQGSSKVWKVEIPGLEFLVGFCGNFAEGSWLRHAFVWPKFNPKKDLMSWLVGEVQPKISKAMKNRFEERKGVEIDFTFMFGVSLPTPRLFVLSMCGDVAESVRNFEAIGSGASVALGCLECLQQLEADDAEKNVLKSLNVSEMYNASVRGPMHCLRL